MKKTLRKIVRGAKNIAFGATLAGALMTTACNNPENNDPLKNYPSETTFVTTAEKVRIEPYYDTDPMFMDGIVVKRFAYGDGSSIPNIEESTKYAKGSPEYEALRHLLTVERSK